MLIKLNKNGILFFITVSPDKFGGQRQSIETVEIKLINFY